MVHPAEAELPRRARPSVIETFPSESRQRLPALTGERLGPPSPWPTPILVRSSRPRARVVCVHALVPMATCWVGGKQGLPCHLIFNRMSGEDCCFWCSWVKQAVCAFHEGTLVDIGRLNWVVPDVPLEMSLQRCRRH